MQSKPAEALRYRRYRKHLDLINKIKPKLRGRFVEHRLYTYITSSHMTVPGRKLDTIMRIKNRLAGGY